MFGNRDWDLRGSKIITKNIKESREKNYETPHFGRPEFVSYQSVWLLLPSKLTSKGQSADAGKVKELHGK